MILDYIETNRLIIREVNEGDFKSIHTYASKPEVTKYLPFGPNNEIDTKFFIEKVMNYKDQNPRCDYEFAVVLKENNTLIGGCGIHIASINNKEGFVGYCFDNEFWGKGYGSEAANAVINFGFNKLNLHRIYGTCHPDNIGSSKVMEKAGMIKEGRLREHKLQKGKWRDSFLYSILDYEYKAKTIDYCLITKLEEE